MVFRDAHRSCKCRSRAQPISHRFQTFINGLITKFYSRYGCELLRLRWLFPFLYEQRRTADMPIWALLQLKGAQRPHVSWGLTSCRTKAIPYRYGVAVRRTSMHQWTLQLLELHVTNAEQNLVAATKSMLQHVRERRLHTVNIIKSPR